MTQTLPVRPIRRPAAVLRAGLASGLVAGLLAAAGPGLAQDADDGPSQISETYRDWRVICVTGDDGTGTLLRQCEMSQQLTLSETGQRVLALALQRTTEGEPLATFVAPFGLRLADGLTIEVGGASVQALGFLTCTPDGCIASEVLAEATMAAMRAGTTAEIRMTALSGESISPQMSLLGFTAAWNRLGALTGG